MFGLSMFSTKKNKTENDLWVSLRHLSIFLMDVHVVNSFLKNAIITHFKFVETRSRYNKILKKQSKICRFSY